MRFRKDSKPGIPDVPDLLVEHRRIRPQGRIRYDCGLMTRLDPANLRDGLIAESLGHFDNEDYRRQLGGGESPR
jgi:hypothetical protein